MSTNKPDPAVVAAEVHGPDENAALMIWMRQIGQHPNLLSQEEIRSHIRDSYANQQAELDRLRPVVEAMDKTVDGAPLTHGMIVRELDGCGEIFPALVSVSVSASNERWALIGGSDDIDPTKCYSTTAAAEAARSAEGEGEG